MNLADANDDRPEMAESAVVRDDQQRSLDHKLDRIAPSRRAVWPKDDRRSSERPSGPAPSDQPERRSGASPRGEPPLQ